MFGVCASRDKNDGSKGTVVPLPTQFLCRSPNSVTFEFAVEGLDGALVSAKELSCTVQCLQEHYLCSEWVKASAEWSVSRSSPAASEAAGFFLGQPLPEVAPDGGRSRFPEERPQGDGCDDFKAARVLCVAKVSGLQPERSYSLRVVARGSAMEKTVASEPIQCHTSKKPHVGDGVSVQCVARTSRTLDLTWAVPDPPGAPILECEIQYRPEGYLTSWECKSMESVTGVSWPVRCWHAALEKLEGNTAYRIRARARNAVGWSADVSPEETHWTSDRPSAPTGLVCLRRHPTSATLAFFAHDPQGAPAHTYDVQVEGVLGYSVHPPTHCHFFPMPPLLSPEGRHLESQRRVLCVVDGLHAETEYSLRVLTHNDSGACKSPSASLAVKTALRPPPIPSMSFQVGPATLAVEWDLEDPVGAPVAKCELEFCRDSMFGAWQTVEAEPVSARRIIAGATSSEETQDPASIAALVAVSELLGSRTLSRRWRALVAGLEHDCAYRLRARGQNAVGWSSTYSPTVCARTTSCPPAPHSLRCVARLPTGVRLEVRVAEVLGTAPVDRIVVEQGGRISWQEVKEVEVKKIDNTEEDQSRWEVFVNMGVSPGVVFELRAWACNRFGKSAAPSESCVCAASDKPTPPTMVFCSARWPHALWLEWATPDPEGAPVWRFEMQGKKDTAFSSWQPMACVDTTRRGLGEVGWRSVLEQLEASTAYRVSLRAYSEVGWSDWSHEWVFETSSAPMDFTSLPVVRRLSPTPPVAEQVGDGGGGEGGGGEGGGCGEGGDGEGGGGGATGGSDEAVVERASALAIDMTLEDPDGAPVLACMVRCKDGGPFVLAKRQGEAYFGGDLTDSETIAPLRAGGRLGRWRVVLPAFEEAKAGSGGKCILNVRTANAVGWTKCQEHCLPITDAEVHCGGSCSSRAGAPPTSEDAAPAADTEECGTLELVLAAIRAALAQQRAAQERLDSLLACANERRDQDHIAKVSAHKREVELRMGALQEVAQQVDPDSGTFGEDHGTNLAKEMTASLQRPLAPSVSVAGAALSLLLRGYLWLEKSWKAELDELTADLAKARGSVPGAGNVLMQWIERHHAWSESFNRRVAEALPDGLARAAHLLVALAGGRRLEALGPIKDDLQACLNFVLAAERQLRRLRNSHRILCCAEASSCHDFERRGVLSKIETSALGLMTMLVLPVPGSIEVGTVGIGMMWLEEDKTNSHLAVEHPSGIPLAPMLQRLGSSPPPRSAVILRGWGSGGNHGVVLVHNATPRRIIVSVSDRDSLAAKTLDKLSAAHPFVRAATAAAKVQDGGDSVAIIAPTEVGLIQVPENLDGGELKKVRLEFAYGTGSSADKVMGSASVVPGVAVSFMRLDSPVHVSNFDEGTSCEEGTVRIANNDLSPADVSIYRAPESQKHFEGALVTCRLEPGEHQDVPLPRPCVGRIFQVEVTVEGCKRDSAEVRPGQCLQIEGAT